MDRRSLKLRSSPLAAALLMGAFAFSACGSDENNNDNDTWKLDDLTTEQGLSIRIPEFDVPAGKEVQRCYFFDVPGNGDIWISRILTAINTGSHHMNLFRVRTIKDLNPDAGTPVDIGGGITAKLVDGGTDPTMSPCWKSPNWSDWPLLTNSQNSNPTDPYTDWTLPDGVAYRLTAGEKLMLQIHYVNATTQTTPEKGRMGVNLYKFAGTNPMEMGTLFATQQSIRICQSNPTPSYSGSCSLGGTAPVTIAAANGHFHSRGKKFEVFAWDGVTTDKPADTAKFYTSTTWDDPPMSRGLNVSIPAAGGVYWTCDYQWSEPAVGCDVVNARDKQMANDCCYTFGPIVEASEHCNVFVYYYPKIGDVFCN